jgi:Tol biopolymer transport system component
MHKLIFVLILTLSGMWLIGCGSSSNSKVVPPPQSQTTTFAFMQMVPNQGEMFSPMLGKFVTTNGNVEFSAAAVNDAASGQPVTGDFYSIILSADGKKATLDLYGGLDRNSAQWDIWVANVDGTNMLQVTNDTNYNRTPQFSPDGSKVIFVSLRPAPDNTPHMQVVTRKLDGTGDTVLPLPTGFVGAWAPTYSPDGTKVAMELWGYDSGQNWYDGIWVMNKDGSSPQMLTNPSATVGCQCHDQTPSFSLDGSKITYSREDWTNPDIMHKEDVYIMNADGTGVTRITDGVGANFEPLVLNIAGVGETILFSSNRDNLPATGGDGFELYGIKPDGSGLTRLTNNTLYDSFNFSFDGLGHDSAALNRR